MLCIENSETVNRKLRDILGEAFGAAFAGAALITILSPGDPTLGNLQPHPLWLLVFLFAARYAALGLLGGLGAGGIGYALACACAGQAPHLTISATTMLLLSGAVFVSWVAAAHEARKMRLASELADKRAKLALAEEAAQEMARVAEAMRDRVDRADTSIAFLRDVAARLEAGDQMSAARAALDLVLSRTGARAGVVRLHDGRALRNLAWQGMFSRETPIPPDLFVDRTSEVALASGRVTSVGEVEGADERDSDLAAPLVSATGARVGVIILRGVPHQVLSHAMARELDIIAQWSGRAIAGAAATPVLSPVEAAPAESEPVQADGTATAEAEEESALAGPGVYRMRRIKRDPKAAAQRPRLAVVRESGHGAA
jgi:hypothetical protein